MLIRIVESYNYYVKYGKVYIIVPNVWDKSSIFEK